MKFLRGAASLSALLAGLSGAWAQEAVPAILAPPSDYADLPVIWSAEPEEGVALEAMAMPYAVLGDFETSLEPGLWRVHGEGAGYALEGAVTVKAKGENRFVVPLSEAPYDWSQPAFVCEDFVPCEISDHLTGLSFALPAGWSAGTPHFLTTAGGARAALPTADFFTLEDEETPALVLNGRQIGANWSCTETKAGSLCLVNPEAPSAAEGYEAMAPTLDFKGFQPWSDEGGD